MSSTTEAEIIPLSYAIDNVAILAILVLNEIQEEKTHLNVFTDNEAAQEAIVRGSYSISF